MTHDMVLWLAAPAPPDKIVHHMSPTATAATLLLALVVDYMSVGPESFRDRIAFFLAVPAIREGFNGSPLDGWTVDFLRTSIRQLLDATGGAYIAGASANLLVGMCVGILFIYTVGCLLPMKMNKKFGRWATLKWPTSPLYRLNLPLWFSAIMLGMLADLPQGIVGDLTEGFVNFLTGLVGPVPNLLFGAS